MKTDDELKEQLCEMGMEHVLIIDGFADAAIGFVCNAGIEAVVYSRRRVTELLMEEGLTEEEAVEYIDYNIAGAYVGEHTPLLLEELPEL